MNYYPPREAKLFIPRTKVELYQVTKLTIKIDIIRYLEGKDLLLRKDLNTMNDKSLYQEILEIFKR